VIDDHVGRRVDLVTRLAARGMTPLAPRTPLEAIDLLSKRKTLPIGSIFIRATCYDRLGQTKLALDGYQEFLKLNKDQTSDMYFEATARSRTLQRELDKKR